MNILIKTAIVISFAFAFMNGFHDGGNVIATVISSRSMKIKVAMVTAVITVFISPVFLGTEVAATIAKSIIDIQKLSNVPVQISLLCIIAALLSAIAWNVITWALGLPSSSSHALVGGLVGAGVSALGIAAINWQSLFIKVILVLIITPIICFVVGYIFIKLSWLCLRGVSYKFNTVLKKFQFFSMVFLAAGHGTGDAQKTMGIISLILVISGSESDFPIPFWVVLGSAGALATGLFFGGWRIIRTVGSKIYKVKPLHSFNAQLAASAVILISSSLGGPVSTSQAMSSSIAGVGCGDRYNAVGWGKVDEIIVSWLLTIPASLLLGFFLFMAIRPVGRLF